MEGIFLFKDKFIRQVKTLKIGWSFEPSLQKIF